MICLLFGKPAAGLCPYVQTELIHICCVVSKFATIFHESIEYDVFIGIAQLDILNKLLNHFYLAYTRLHLD